MTRRQNLQAGVIFDKWTLSEKIGEGGNGEVWKANDADGNICAIKILKNSNDEKIARFEREIRILSSHQIPGVMPIISHTIPENTRREYSWYAMPLATSFATFIHGKKAIKIAQEFLPLINTVKHLHELGISHRDIKPDNFLYYGERLCLADFGLAKTTDSEPITPERRDVGAKFTMAPEMRRTASTADGKLADIFSLAKSLWIALTKNELGFDGQYDSNSSIGLSKFDSELFFVPLDELLTAATQHSPELRPSIDNFSSALELWIHLNENFHERNHAEWRWLQKLMFPAASPVRAEWNDLEDIISILSLISKNSSLNHMFYPGGGGNDLERVSHADENGLIALHVDEVSAELMKPIKLCFESFGYSPEWNYFWLEADNIPLSGIPGSIDYKGMSETLTEVSPGSYENIGVWEMGEFEGERLPEKARPVSRYFKGAFVFFSKRSVYNLVGSTYDGRHQEMGEAAFREHIKTASKKHHEHLLTLK